MVGDPEFRIIWELLGVETSAVEDWSVDTGYLTAADEFRVSLPVPKGFGIADMALQPVTLTLNDATLMLGKVEHISSGHKPGHVTISGRDYMGELVENNIDPFCVVREGDTLGKIITHVCGPQGISSVVDDGGFSLRQLRTGGKAKGRKKGKKTVEIQAQELKPEPGLGVYEYISRILRRYGATLQPGTTREEVLVAAPDYDQDPSGVIKHTSKGNGSRNINEATAERDFSQFPTYVLSTGQGGKEGETRETMRKTFDWVEANNADVQKNGATDESGKAKAGYGFAWVTHKSSTRDAQTRFGTDTAQAAAGLWAQELALTVEALSHKGRRKPGEGGELDLGEVYRFLYIRDQTARTTDMLEKAVTRLVSERLRRTLTYQVSLNGAEDPDTGILYAPDTIVSVEDDVNEVAENLWVSRRSFHGSPRGGLKTRLECWRPGSFVIA